LGDLGKPAIDTTELLKLTDQLKDLHHKLYEHLSLMDERIKANNAYSNVDLADLGFLCREQEELSDEMRKNSKVRKELISKVLVLKYAAAAMSEPFDSIKGNYARASAFRIKKIGKIPEYGSPDYIAYMESLGIPKEVIDKGLVKPDWEQTSERLTQLIEDGKKLPPGIGQTWDVYTCTFTRTRKKIEEDSEV